MTISFFKLFLRFLYNKTVLHLHRSNQQNDFDVEKYKITTKK